MNYIYDILINFNNNIYDFYDWNKSDEIIHIRKTPLLKVETKTVQDIIQYKIKGDTDFLNRIYKRSEVFQKKHVAIINYMAIITDGEQVIAVKFNKEGLVNGYSRLLIDEELEVIEYSESLKLESFSYEKISKNKIILKTREETKIKTFIELEIKKILKEENYEKLEYLYLECFNKQKDITYIIKNINKEIKENWDEVYLNLYQFFKVTI